MTGQAGLARLAASLDPAWLSTQRWFASKARAVESLELVGGIEAGSGSALLVLDVRLSGGAFERYAVPVGSPLWSSLLPELARGARAGFELEWLGAVLPEPNERELGRDQSNTTYVLGERVALKCYRRLWPGPHPEIELVGFLSGRSPLVPTLRGTVTYRDRQGVVWPVALVQDFVPNAPDGWAFGQALLEEALADGRVADRTTAWAASLGRELAELQLALCELESRPATPADAASWRRAALDQLDLVLALPGAVATTLRPLAPAIRAELDRLGALDRGLVTRVHGDLHIGQVLRSEAGFHLIDFEGEPTRPAADRRALQSPLRDLASMMRSFEHLARWNRRADADAGRLALALRWADRVAERFLEGYAGGAAGTALHVDRELVRAFEIEKETYELVYAAEFLAEWTPIALASLESLVASSAAA